KRCLIRVSDYYEWQDTPTGKQPWYFTARFEQIAVLPLYLHVHSRAQQVGGARELAREVRLPFLGCDASAHSRGHAPRQKRRPCRKAADFALADGLQAEL